MEEKISEPLSKTQAISHFIHHTETSRFKCRSPCAPLRVPPPPHPKFTIRSSRDPHCRHGYRDITGMGYFSFFLFWTGDMTVDTLLSTRWWHNAVVNQLNKRTVFYPDTTTALRLWHNALVNRRNNRTTVFYPDAITALSITAQTLTASTLPPGPLVTFATV